MNNKIFGVDLIQSKSNSTVTELSKLLNKKYREQRKLFVCDGIKLFLEAVTFEANIRYIVLENNTVFSDEILQKIKECVEKGTIILCVEDYVFAKLTSENSPQGIITVCDFYDKMHTFSANVENHENESVIMLQSIRDPGNMGTIMRNAVALGIDRLVLSSDCVDIYSPKVIRASMGAIFKIKVDVVTDFLKSVEIFKQSDRRVLSAAIDDRALILGKDSLERNDVVILGNEGHGISDDVIKASTNTLFIPMRENTESLNVAMASAIIMWEISKKFN
jgi:TrmH family RNA methyltransferase